jgi:hypothetical protein
MRGFSLRPDGDAPPSQTPASWDAWLVGCLCLGAALRVAAAVNDLWLDEIWTLWMLGQEVKEPLDLVRGAMRHDNNHLLNSAWMYALGPHRPSLVYRLPAILAGVAAIAIAWAIGRQRSGAAARFAAVAFAISYVLVNCQSEARGYGLLSASVLAGQWALAARFFRSRGEAVPAAEGGPAHAAWFNVACLVGLLSHATFVLWYLAALSWTAVKIAAGKGSVARKLGSLAAWHALPLAALAAVYLGLYRGMTVGGGPESSPFTTVCQTLSLLAGGPAGSPGSLIVAGCVATVGLLCLVQATRRAAEEAAFFLLAILVVPAAVLASFPVACYAARHFIVPSIVLMVLITRELPDLFRGSRLLHGGVVALAVAAAGGNLARDAALVARGRGDYAATLDWMRSVSADPQGVITCYSNHEFRNRLLIAYHSASIPGGRYRLYDAGSLPPHGAEWYILFDSREGGVGKDRIADRHGNPYRLLRSMRSGGLTPSHWHVYRRESSL